MAYVEWLRVRACLKWTGIALGVLFLVAVGLRIAAVGVEHDLNGRLTQLRNDPGSQVSETVLPGGAHRTTIYNPVKKMRAVIDDRGWNGRHIVLDDWSSTAKQDLTEHFGSQSMGATFGPDRHGRSERIDVTLSGPTPVSSYFVVGFIVAMIVATVLGAPFAREGDGHLEVALSKPISRELFALETILIDWGGLIAAFCAATVVGIAVHLLFDVPHITFDGRDAIVLAVGILGPIAWYSMLAAATASLTRGYGAVLGFAWPVAAIVLGLSLADTNGNAVFDVVHRIAWVLSFIDPLRYATAHGEILAVGAGGPASIGFGLGFGPQIVGLAALTVAYGTLAVIQWRRIEA